LPTFKCQRGQWGAGDADLNPAGIGGVMEKLMPELFARCGKLIAERRVRPTNDLMSVLIHAEVDGERLEELVASQIRTS
jgi:cholest-4-en-3-one 26-monooxygenase